MTSKNNRAPLLYYIKLCKSFRTHWSIQTAVTVQKRSIWDKLGDHISVLCDLEIWWITLTNNRAPLLCYLKLWKSFQSHRWIQTGVTDDLKNNKAPLLCYFNIWASFHWPAHRAGLLWLNFFGQPGSFSKFPPLLWVKLWVGWVGRGYTEISRYFPASWINWVTLVTKIKLLYSLRF